MAVPQRRPANGHIECRAYGMSRSFLPVSRFVSEMIQDRAMGCIRVKIKMLMMYICFPGLGIRGAGEQCNWGGGVYGSRPAKTRSSSRLCRRE